MIQGGGVKNEIPAVELPKRKCKFIYFAADIPYIEILFAFWYKLACGLFFFLLLIYVQE